MTESNSTECFLNHLWLEKGLSDETRSAYRSDLSQCSAWLRERDTELTQATAAQLSEYLQWRHQQNYQASSTQRLISSLRGCFRYWLREGVVSEDITQQLHTPKKDQTLPRSLSEAEVERLLSAPETDTPLGLRDRCMLEILYACGVRVSELVNLTLEQLNLRQGVVRIDGKGNRQRLVPMGEEAIDWLQRYLQLARPQMVSDSDSRVLFPGRKNKPMTRQTFWHRIKHHAIVAGISNPVSPHVIRHAFATHLLNHGADLRVVQLLLGHNNLSTTQIYTHIANHRLRELHRKHHPRG